MKIRHRLHSSLFLHNTFPDSQVRRYSKGNSDGILTLTFYMCSTKIMKPAQQSTKQNNTGSRDTAISKYT